MRLLGVHRLHHRMGGAEAVHLDHLALFRQRGWRCAEFAMDHPDNEASDWQDYFAPYYAPRSDLSGVASLPRFFYSGEARKQFARLLDDFRPDVVHMHGIYHQLTSSILGPARERGVPIVFTLHDYKLICPAHHFYNERDGVCEKCAGGRQWNCLIRRCARESLAKDAVYAVDGLTQWHFGSVRETVARFVAPSRFMEEKYAEHGFPREKLRYVPNFFESADDEAVSPSAVEAIRAAHGRHILYFGRLSPEKGVDILIDAAASAGAPLVIVGDGPRREELERQAQRLRARCVFTGHLKGAALWAHVEAASAVALTSVCYENAPKSVLEAQARGRPVVATRIGGLPEMVEDGVSGLIAEPSDRSSLAKALSRILAMNEAELAEFGARGRAHALSNFTRDRYYREMTAIYAELSPALAIAS